MAFGEVAERSRTRWRRAWRAGSSRGDVVLTLVGNRPEWVLTMVACFRLGLVVLPCNEQLRAKDLELRLRVAQPRLVVCDERNTRRARRRRLGRPDAVGRRRRAAPTRRRRPPPSSAPEDPCLITFTSRHGR